MSIREDLSGSIAGFERGRGIVMVCYTSLPLCLIGESFFDFDHTLSFTLSPFSTIWPLVGLLIALWHKVRAYECYS